MSRDPDLHRRRSIRLREYDYTSPGAYFVTICTYDRMPLFGTIVDGVMRLNDMGRIADDFIVEIPKRYPGMMVDCHMVMPDHVHMVLMIGDTVGATFVGAIHELPLQGTDPSDPARYEKWRLQRRAMLIPQSIGYYRMNTAKRINRLRNAHGARIWQRNYFEHVIRNERSLRRIRRYIADNPRNWEPENRHDPGSAPDSVAL